MPLHKIGMVDWYISSL